MRKLKILVCSILFLCYSTLSLFSQCYPDRHNTSLESSWISCQSSANPNPAQSSGHWILYELEEKRTISSIKLWNLNHPDYLDSGVKTISIDYEVRDGIWENHSNHTVAKAEASGFYEGEELNLESEFVTDKVLITFSENYGGNCFGIAEARIGTKQALSTSVFDTPLDYFNISVSPNPFFELAAVSLENISGNTFRYRILNNLGEIIREREVAAPNGNASFEIDGKNLSAGVYYLQVLDGQRVSSKKLFQQNH